MKKLHVVTLTALMGLAIHAKATLYDINFNGSGYVANGQINVVSGVATSGFLTVTAGYDLGTYNLVPLGSPLITGIVTPTFSTIRISGGDQIFDDLVFPSSTPFLNGNGIEFANDLSVGFDIWGNGDGSYNIYNADVNHYGYPPGTATIALAPVPEASTVIAGLLLLLPFGASAFRVLRKNQSA